MFIAIIIMLILSALILSFVTSAGFFAANLVITTMAIECHDDPVYVRENLFKLAISFLAVLLSVGLLFLIFALM